MRAPEIRHSKPWITAEDHAAVTRVLASGMIADGEQTRAFERAVGDYMGVAPGLATGSGTAALSAALMAVGVEPGHEVVIPAYVCDAVWSAVRAIGATPVLCDVEDDRCVSRGTVELHLTPRTRAVVVVHPFGCVADVAAVASLGVAVVEDCCQAFGASRDGRMAGTIGAAAVLSFHATKLLATGEGGMAVSAVPAVSQRLRDLRHRAAGVPEHPLARLSDLQSALGLSQLARYGAFLSRRRQLADFYFTELAATVADLPANVRARSIFFRFPVRSTMPFDRVQAAFAAEDVHVRRGVDQLLHRQAQVNVSFATTERLFAETVSLPIYPALTDAEAARVVAAAKRVFPRRG